MCILPRPSNEFFLLASIDSQRYDLSKRQKLSPLPTLVENETPDGRAPALQEISEKQSSAATGPLLRDQVQPNIASLSEGNCLSDSDQNKTSDSQCADKSRAAQPSSKSQTTYHDHDCSISKYITELFKRKERVHTVDTYEKEDGETVRIVIRPFKRDTSRPTSPVNSIFRRLDCTCCADTFEEELDFVQDQREKTLAGVIPKLEVSVKEKSTVTKEEKWRDAIQAILYERRGFPATDSVFGHVEVC